MSEFFPATKPGSALIEHHRRMLRNALTKWPVRAQAVEWTDAQAWDIQSAASIYDMEDHDQLAIRLRAPLAGRTQSVVNQRLTTEIAPDDLRLTSQIMRDAGCRHVWDRIAKAIGGSPQ